MIELQVTHKSYAQKTLFKDFRLQLAEGELLCLLGPSGCGKTSLLNMVAGLDNCFQGQLLPTTAANNISYMFQQPRLLPWRTVWQNLALVVETSQHYKIAPLLEVMGLGGYADVYPNRLSLGMARRVALARCLIVEPQLILMDEPFVSLDPPTVAEMRQLVQQVRALRPQTSILFVTHDLREAVALADRILVLGQQPTRVLSQWHSQIPQVQRDADYLVEQEQMLLRSYASKHPEQETGPGVEQPPSTVQKIARVEKKSTPRKALAPSP